jgi:hypothetical protein
MGLNNKNSIHLEVEEADDLLWKKRKKYVVNPNENDVVTMRFM